MSFVNPTFEALATDAANDRKRLRICLQALMDVADYGDSAAVDIATKALAQCPPRGALGPDPFAQFRHKFTLPTDAEVYVVEAEIFGVNEDGEDYCKQTCSDDRHDKFCPLSIGYREQDRTDWARRVAIWQRLYGFNECPFDGGAVYALQGDSCGVWKACQRCGSLFAVVERMVDMKRAFFGAERKIVGYVEDERRVVCGVVHPATFEEVKS